jgi:CheY-like chemotaxis protein
MREPPRILVVDDNPANLEILEARLQEMAMRR